MQRRREIDGLRAIAVISVILYHTGLEAIGGGFIGVDIFFVISGFLITNIIVSEQETGRFSLLRFYERRARRILPALFCMMALSIPFACFLMTPLDLADFSKSLLATAAFISNIHFSFDRGYFNTALELKPLLHTWSLAVEEQFYLLFPLILMALAKLRRRHVMAILVCLAVASLLFAQWFAMRKEGIAFFILPTRAWELLAGAILALLIAGNSLPSGLQRYGEALGGVGVLLVLYAIVAFDRSVPAPGLLFLLPTLGTALIITFARTGTVMGSILQSSMLVGIGLISYSAYLWHWPLFAFARYVSPSEPGPGVFAILICVTFALAYLSWRYVEQPFRAGTFASRSVVFYGAGTGMAAALLIGLAGYLSGGFPQRFPADIIIEASQPICERKSLAEYPSLKACEFGDKASARSLILYGDSHAKALSNELDKSLKAANVKGIYVELDRCEVIPQTFTARKFARQSLCDAAFADLLSYIKETSSDVVISIRWTFRFNPIAGVIDQLTFTNSEGGMERETYREYFVRSSDGKTSIVADDKRQAFRQFIEGMLSTGANLHVVYPVPEMGWNINRLNLLAYWGTGQIAKEISISEQDYLKRNAFVLSLLAEYETLRQFSAVKPQAIFCSTFVTGRCVAQFDGIQYYADDDHLSDVGARRVIKAIFTDQWTVDGSL